MKKVIKIIGCVVLGHIVLISIICCCFFYYTYANRASYKGEIIPTSEFSTDSIVDLGLSVKWKNYNVGATTVYDCGETFMWDSIKGKMMRSIDVNTDSCMMHEYAEFNVPSNSSGRYPTNDEFEELMRKCEWKRVKVKNTEGLLVTGPNKNKIFLPALCIRDIETYSTDRFKCLYATKNRSNSFGHFSSFWQGSDGFDPIKGISKIMSEDTNIESDTLLFDFIKSFQIRLVVDKK